MSSRALEFEHEATGLRLLHVSNDDVENLFSINFPTPPPDDTGPPHILEHCVLAGSRKYPALARVANAACSAARQRPGQHANLRGPVSR